MIPQNFGCALPQRCLEILDALGPRTPRGESGFLSTTFLLTMAMPLFVFPDQALNGRERLVFGDVNRLRPEVATALARPLPETPFGRRPDGAPIRWSWSRMPDKPRHPRDFERARPAPLSVVAEARAAAKTGNQLLKHVRRALAHAGVVYLDAKGRYEPLSEAKTLGLVSEYGDPDAPKYNVVLVSEDDFRACVHAWAGWLARSGFDRMYDAA